MRYDLPDSLAAGMEQRPSWRMPLDERDVAVRLECDGITDAVAADTYGYSGVREMAAEWYPRVGGIAEGELGVTPRKHALVEHLRGTIFALPLAICFAVMIFYGYSLWGGDLESGAAAAVAIGTVGSFIITGGIVQAMAWQGLFYAGSGDFRMSSVACQRWTAYGGITLTGGAAVSLALNAQYGWLSGNLALLALAFYLVMGLLWLGTGLLYIVEAPLQVTVAVGCGVAVVLMLHGWLGVPLLPSQIAGILTGALVAFAAGFAILRRRHAGDSGRVYPRMIQRTLYVTAPYLLYGSIYYVLLFCDRLIAWTAQTGAASTPLVFRGDYELPHDIALLGFILGVGWVHSSSYAFYDRAGVLLRECALDRAEVFNNRMLRFHLARIAVFVPASYAAGVVIWLVASKTGLLATPQAEGIAAIALAAFPWLTVGLWNSSLLFALSLPWVVLPPAAGAVAANAACGYALSRIWSYELAVVGFLLGAVVFGVASSVAVRRRFRRLDYYYLVSGA